MARGCCMLWHALMGRPIAGCRRASAAIVDGRRWNAARRLRARRHARCNARRQQGGTMTNARSGLRQLLIPIVMVASLVGTVRVADARCDGSDGTYQTCIREEGACLASWRSWTCGG